MARKRPGTRDPAYVTRREFAAILRTLDERKALIEDLQRTCAIQFKRIAQMQMELDDVRRAWTRAQSSRKAR